VYTHEYKKRIRYGETDQMGYLYYGNYAMLFEIGRVEALRSIGVSYKELEEKHRVMMPVLSLESRYLGPAKYDEEIIIRTILKQLPSKMIHFYHEIVGEQGKVIHKGEVKLFFVDMETNKRVSTPKHLIDKLKPLF